jgi:DNA mismatch endonuclease (patch repair protein)
MPPNLKQRTKRRQLADIVDPVKRSEMMAGIRSKNTRPELVVRKTLHALGYRFRLHRKDLPGKPDVVLPKWGTVVFVHGCFWHGHERCPQFRLPKSKTTFWSNKIAANQRRDNIVKTELLSKGWRIIEVWECAIKGPRRLKHESLSNFLSHAIELDQKDFVSIRGLNSVES